MQYGVHEEQPRVTNRGNDGILQMINNLYAWQFIEFDLKFKIANGNVVF